MSPELENARSSLDYFQADLETSRDHLRYLNSLPDNGSNPELTREKAQTQEAINDGSEAVKHWIGKVKEINAKDNIASFSDESSSKKRGFNSTDNYDPNSNTTQNNKKRNT